ncbi:Hypothetical protein NCS54_00906000 [Fusarium falciforme]|uniref:Hypothetical protein n=1 Tax=Fusarium falciforme TaxID=195108 RepID=UPI002301A146|nr:Hypothetical protein NCS54_00906000 [Fusarium falciforme]WAO91584.1 Hypothetical protein NCS54_00906000 [Fusarium falciforme]
MDVPSFTLRFKAPSDDPTQPVQNCQLHIVSSGVVEVFANGATATIDTEGKWYQAGAFIVASVIVSTADMSSFVFQVDQFQAAGGNSVVIQADVLNPNGKLNSKLAFIQHADDLLNAKTQTGDPLITPGAVNQQDAERAAAMINQFNKTQIFLGRPGQPLKRNDNSPKLYNPKTKRPTIIAGIGFFSWCFEKAKQATSWVLQKIGNTLNSSWTALKPLKAMSWVFEKINVGVQKLIDFVGVIFQWGDVLDTSDSIVAFINAGLEYAQDQVSGLRAKEQQFMQTLKDSDSEEKSSMDAAKNSVTYNWVSGCHVGHTNSRGFNAFSLLMAIPVTAVYRVVKGTALPSLKGMDKTTFAAYVNGTLGDDDSDFCITRTQIQIVGFAIAAKATHLEVGFQLISWVTNKIQGLAAETIDTGLIFVGVTMLIIGWPVASQKDMGMRFIVCGFDYSSVVALATACFVSWKTSTPRSETAPAVATWVALTSIPSYMIKIIVNNNSESSDPSPLNRPLLLRE